MPWYWYHSGAWQIAVDAVNRRDANGYVRRYAPGATYDGEYRPPTAPNWSTATAMTTERRQVEISNSMRELEKLAY